MAPKKVGKKPDVKKTRKQLRKEDRKNKKIRRNEYYTKRKKPGQFVLLTDQHRKNMEKDVQNDQQENKIKEKPKVDVKNKVQVLDRKVLTAEDFREKERKQQMKLQKEMNKQRKKQLLQANLEEDRNIKQLEKQLKLNKRKSKSIPTSFATDGLDYLLEACDLENMKSSALAEQQLTEVNDEFEEDLVLMTETGSKHANKVDKEKHSYSSEDDQSYDDSDGDSSEDETSLQSKKRSSKLERGDNKKPKISSEDLDDDLISEDGDEDDSQNNISDDDNLNDISDESDSQNDISDDVDNLNDVSDDDNNQDEFSDNDDNLSNESITENDSNIEGNDLEDSNGEDENITQKKNDDGTWEDIYGRLRAKDGTIMTSKDQKYVPPAVRMKMETGMDKIRNEKLNRLKKQLKGLLNRLAESNMHSIAKQIEELYMNNSRNDMNNTITNLIVEALVSNIIAPERLLMEHVMLVAILHANVGTEVGAHFLQTVVKLFDEHCKTTNAENKMLDNVVIILAQLYNFKLFDSKLIYEILEKLTKNFEEKDVECILHMLRNVGFNLRKDNPMALKNLILSLQKQASGASDEMRDNSRVKFMLDVLLAIKNNNVTKIPNYDTSYSEHLKKIMKGFIRKGNYVTQLNISLEDLLKAEEKGKWWVVGSAWTGNNTENSSDDAKQTPNSFSQKLLQLAAKQRMNTDTRKNIFCIIMSAEDYLDAFEKLLHLSLKNQQEREIIHVTLHCCLQEKTYNPYYATLAQKFCEYDRKYQMTIKYSIWDKLKALKDHSATQISHLAKLLSHLFVEKGLPISTLKVVQFSELDKVTLRFIRQILLGILLHEDPDVCKEVFNKVGQSEKLKLFRESLRLFLHHFLLRNLNSQSISNEKKEMLQQRVKLVEKLLTGKESRW